jgi:hypothetical protein
VATFAEYVTHVRMDPHKDTELYVFCEIALVDITTPTPYDLCSTYKDASSYLDAGISLTVDNFPLRLLLLSIRHTSSHH